MTTPSRDPYQILGLSPGASDDELHTAYRRLVQLHHPDHNGGSPESARRFEEIQLAYGQIREQRQKAPRASKAPRRASTAPPHGSVDPAVEARLAELERELREAHAARERARRAAREAAAASYERPSDEELGYVRTDDTLGKILDDARAEMTDRLARAREHPVGRRVSELIDELASKLGGDPPSGSER